MPFKDPNRKRQYHHTYNQAYYANNLERERLRIHRRRDKLKAWFRDTKSRLRCNRCGENHPACLQFHHLDPGKKDLSLSAAIRNGWSIKRLESEIAKCEVLCANCHFKEHYEWVFMDYVEKLNSSTEPMHNWEERTVDSAVGTE